MSGIFDPAAMVEITSASGLMALSICVFLDQVGFPVPAFPAIMAASAVASVRHHAVWPIFAVAAAATLAADFAWYSSGKRFGAQMLRLVCRLSLTPDACVSSTRDVYARWGGASLVFAKFVPGLAALATTLAGDKRVPSRTFLAFDGLGAIAWAGLAVTLGVLFDDTIRDLLHAAHVLGRGAGLTAFGVIGALLAWKLVRRKWLSRAHAISPRQLRAALRQRPLPVIVDARSAYARAIGDGIPSAVSRECLLGAAREADIVVYCDCPDDAAARALARELRRRDFASVRVLTGGLRAWRATDVPIVVAHASAS